MDFCKNVKEWLGHHQDNVAVIHCKAGKGRTGLMICSYLLYSKEWSTPQQAMEFYAAMRTHNKKGVTIPSQIRYVQYFGSMAQSNYVLPSPRPILLKSVQFHTIPKLPKVTDIRFSVYVVKSLVYTYKETPKLRNTRKKKGFSRISKDKSQLPLIGSSPPKESTITTDGDTVECLIFECPPIPICGDIKMEFYEKETFGSDQKLFAFWFNTSFTIEDPQVPHSFFLEVAKEGLDKAQKDRQCKIFKENFKVLCNFQTLDTNAKSVPATEFEELVLEEKKKENCEEVLQSPLLTPLTEKYPCLKNF